MVISDLQSVHFNQVADPYFYLQKPKDHVLVSPAFDSELKAVSFKLSDVFLGAIKDAQVFGNGFLAVGDKKVLYGMSNANYAKNLDQQLKHYTEVKDGEYLDDELVLLWGHPNFGHWLFVYLLRLTLLWYRPELKRFRLLIRRDIPRRYLDWLELMGLKNYVFADDWVKVKKLWVPSIPFYRGHYENLDACIFPEALHILRHLILKDLQLPRFPRTRLYISRAKDSYRQLENEEELLGLLEAHHFQRIFMQGLPVDKQLDLVSRAEMIITHIGGGSPITMFAPRDCKILELSLPRFVGTFASSVWSQILGQPFERIEMKPTKFTGQVKPLDYDSIVDLDEVRKYL